MATGVTNNKDFFNVTHRTFKIKCTINQILNQFMCLAISSKYAIVHRQYIMLFFCAANVIHIILARQREKKITHVYVLKIDKQ